VFSQRRLPCFLHETEADASGLLDQHLHPIAGLETRLL
jgi:hypothetical protein